MANTIPNPYETIYRMVEAVQDLVLDVRKHQIVQSGNPLPEEKPLTRQQAADFLQVTPPTLDAWVKAGLVERRVIANEVRFLPSDLLAALKKPEISRVQSRRNKKA